ALLDGGGPLATEQVGRVHGVPADAQVLGERAHSVGQSLYMVEQHDLGHRCPPCSLGVPCSRGYFFHLTDAAPDRRCAPGRRLLVRGGDRFQVGGRLRRIGQEVVQGVGAREELGEGVGDLGERRRRAEELL